MYNLMGILRGCHADKFDSCNNLLSSIHTCTHSVVCQIEYIFQFLACFTANLCPQANSAIPCRWEDEKRTGYLPLYAKAKKMKSLTLHTYGCRKASLRDCSSFSY